MSESRVKPVDNFVTVQLPKGPAELPLQTLPEKYIDWIEEGRRATYAQLLKGDNNVPFFSQHLPVIVTQTQDKLFPFNCSRKGLGFIPKEQYLPELIELFQKALHDTQKQPWRKSLGHRLNVVSQFFLDREKVDYRAMTTLEIFKKRTYANLSEFPLASILFTGDGPDYMSFQLNCAVEVITPDDPRHTFIRLARNMFEHDHFHITQSTFPYAYLFWINEVIDKTPYQVKEPDPASLPPIETKMEWQFEALASIRRAPGMIQEMIREKIEEAATEQGLTEITLEFVQQAKELFKKGGAKQKLTARMGLDKRGTKPYKKLYLPLDGSKYANSAMSEALTLAQHNKAGLFGVHVYAAKLHDQRFRAMEGGLPEEYQQEQELERQREVHDSLITSGLELISDSYLKELHQECLNRDLPFQGISLEGRNWQELAKDIESHDYDLVMMGGYGIGRVTESLLGTVTERLLRRVHRDIFICKETQNEARDTILVCLDGSSRSWGGLFRAFQLASVFDKKVFAVSAFDPYFHYTMFNMLNKVLSEQAREVFKFEEQEQLHEDIIDSGLAKIYQSHLEVAKRVAEDEGVALETKLLDGKAYKKILEFAEERPPWLLVMGRTGIHSDEEMDIGGNTEHVCRLAKCNLLIVDTPYQPPTEYQAEEMVSWTQEAEVQMERIPAMARGIATKSVQNYCIAEGYTVVTTSVLQQAIQQLLPAQAIEKMGIKIEVTQRDAEKWQKQLSLVFRCDGCGQTHRGQRPKECPICHEKGSRFTLIESAMVEDGVEVEALGSRSLVWEPACLAAWRSIEDEVTREQLKNVLEKRALTQRLTSITGALLIEAAPLSLTAKLNQHIKDFHSK